MLKIILGCTLAEELLPKDMLFELFTHKVFDYEVSSDWLADPFCQKIIREIDNAVILGGATIQAIDTEELYSARELSGGTKFLILEYMNTDPNRAFMMYMGDNCCDYLEQIVAKLESEGKDLWVVSDYVHSFNFKYIKEIYYANWNVTCRSKKEIFDDVQRKFTEQQSKIYKMGRYREDKKVDWEGEE